jgi:hypothetical protein
MDFDQFNSYNIIYFPCVGKIPSIKKWQDLTAAKVAKGKSNYGILCGQASNITVIDIDLKADGIIKNGMDIWNMLKNQFNNGEDPETPIVKTGSGGFHIYFKYNPALKTGSHCIKGYDQNGYKLTYSVDIRNDGGYVIAPGSIHPETKKKYKFIQEFDECDTIETPEWLVSALTMDIYINDMITFEPRLNKVIKTAEITEASEHIPENLDEALFRKIILSLSKDRAHSYNDWIKVCWAVGAIDRNFGWNNLDAVIEFSKKSISFLDDYDVEKHYEEANGSIGLGSLWYWLKEDDPEAFNILYKEYKNQRKNTYYYGDYKHLVKKHEENGGLIKAEVKEYLKGAFVKIDNGGNTRWLSRNKDDDGTDLWELIYDKKPFMDNNIKINLFNTDADPEKKDEKIKTSFSNILNEYSVHPEFSIYDKLDFRPYLTEDQKNYAEGEVFNLFTGFSHKPEGDYDEELIAPILYHMKEILSGGNEEFYKYYLQYLAHAIQYPNDKPGVAIIFISKEGLGKDLLNYDFLIQVFGQKLLHRVNDLSAITRKFNKKLQGKLMTIIGEIKSYNDSVDSEKLKGILTDATINIEPKGKDPYEVRDYQRFICHTNNAIPVGITASDRRFVIHKVDGSFIQSAEYYNDLVKTIKNPEVAAHFFKYLAQMDLSNFNVRERPYTIAKQEIQILTAPNPVRFMVDVYNKRWTLINAKIKDDEIKIHTANLYDNYTRWINENGEKNKLSLKIFKQKLEEYGFMEYEKQFKLNSAVRNGYKTSFNEIKNCFKAFILEKNNNDAEEEDAADCLSDED